MARVISGVRAQGIEIALLGLTASRLLLVVPLIWGIANNPLLAAAALLVLIIVDVVDGAVARAFDVETPLRRLVDSTVDKISIHSASIAVVILEPTLLALYLPLALRDALLSTGSLWCLARRHILIAGGPQHRAASLSYACLGFSALALSPAFVVAFGLFAWIVNYALIADYWHTFKAVIRDPAESHLKIRSR
jgi:phosphatidylglycerophosphate synthase